VAGIVALIVSENRKLSPAQVRDILEQTARNKPAGGRNDQYGFGIVDPVAALKAAATVTGVAEAPTAGSGTVAAHFGYGPTEIVSEQTSSFGAMPRAIAGGLVLLAVALALALRILRRARKEAVAAAAEATAAMAIEPFPPYGPPAPPGFPAPPGSTGAFGPTDPLEPTARLAAPSRPPVEQAPVAEPPSWPPHPGG